MHIIVMVRVRASISLSLFLVLYLNLSIVHSFLHLFFCLFIARFCCWRVLSVCVSECSSSYCPLILLVIVSTRCLCGVTRLICKIFGLSGFKKGHWVHWTVEKPLSLWHSWTKELSLDDWDNLLLDPHLYWHWRCTLCLSLVCASGCTSLLNKKQKTLFNKDVSQLCGCMWLTIEVKRRNELCKLDSVESRGWF